MAKSIDDFLDYTTGDIITLSDSQTQIEFDELSVEFVITEVRTWKGPDDLFTYTGYIAEYTPAGKDTEQVMLLVREVDREYDLRVYYLDQDCGADELAHALVVDQSIDESLYDEEERTMLPEISETLAEQFNATIFVGDEELPVRWDRQAVFFGVMASSTGMPKEDMRVLGLYFTEDETGGNKNCMIEWSGDSETGWFEVWYGCDVVEQDVAMERIGSTDF